MRFPSVNEVAKELRNIDRSGGVPGEFIDVRLQVYKDGTWAVRVGDASYDQDHHGYWGASSIPWAGSFNATETAEDLIGQVKESFAMHGDIGDEGAWENPLSMSTPEMVGIGAALVAGVAAAIYYATRPAAAASTPGTTPSSTPTPTTITLSAGTGTGTASVVPLAATVPAGGLYIALPAGAVWTGQALAMVTATAGGTSSTSIFVPNPGVTQTSPTAVLLTWTDASGTAQSTNLTLTA